MPNLSFDRIRLPSTKVYTLISLGFFVGCVYQAIIATSKPYSQMNSNMTSTTNQHQHHRTSNDLQEFMEIITNWDSVITEQLTSSSIINKPSLISKTNQEQHLNETRTIRKKLEDIVYFMSEEPVCIWVICVVCLRSNNNNSRQCIYIS